MAVDYQTKKQIEEEMLDQDIVMNCTRATCMLTVVLTKKEYKLMLEENRMLKCPKCGSKMI